MRARPADDVGGSEFDDLAEIHYGDQAADMHGDCQIVRDADECEIKIAFQVRVQIQDVSLNGDVERSRRFVEEDDLRLAHDDASKRDTELLTRRQDIAPGLVFRNGVQTLRVTLHELRQTDAGEDSDELLVSEASAPLIHEGLPTSRLVGPKAVRTACWITSERPQVASRVSNGRP